MDHFMHGFEKRAANSHLMKDLAKTIRRGGTALGALGGMTTGVGAGLLARAKYEEKFKEDEDKTRKDKIISHGPVYLGVGGLLAGAALGRHRGNVGAKHIEKFIPAQEAYEEVMRAFRRSKTAALKKDVELKTHQNRAIDKLFQNNGSLLAAHATGSGKTLTGIAGFEKLKEAGKAKRAIVVVPAGLRENFVDNLKRFTDSTYTVFGPKSESRSKSIGDSSTSDYNIISYELFREHGDKLIASTGADTLIMDEVHRARGTEGTTYNKLRDLRPSFRNAITLTGSIVNNQPNDVVPLMDITFTPQGHKLISKNFFDKLFVSKDAKAKGIFSPKVEIVKGLKNKKQLAAYLGSKVDFVSHKDLEKDMPAKEVQTVEIPMSKEQKKLYDFTLSSVDPITRWKIRNNLPVGQREAKDAFSKLMQARQVSTDPSILDKKIHPDQDPSEYSSKVKAVVDDAVAHLDANSQNKTVIFGNLLQGQLNAVEKALGHRKIPYARFVGLGNEGMTAKTRPKEIQDFMSGNKRVLMISGAGAEGLDLKDATMMQMLEGHYNPERIQQAEARVRRLGSKADKVLIKRYVSKPTDTGAKKLLSKLLSPIGLGGASKGVDSWIYSIAEGKDKLNEEFRDVLTKSAEGMPPRPDMSGYSDLMDNFSQNFLTQYGLNIASTVGSVPGKLISKAVIKRRDKEMEAKMKQMLLDRGLEQFTKKQHYSKILAESKLDERRIDAAAGVAMATAGATLLSTLYPGVSKKVLTRVGMPIAKGMTRAIKSIPKEKLFKGKLHDILTNHPDTAATVIGVGSTGLLMGLANSPLQEYASTLAQRAAIGDTKDLDIGIQRYTDKMRKKLERKYKSSKGFVQEYDTKEELGIDQISGM